MFKQLLRYGLLYKDYGKVKINPVVMCVSISCLCIIGCHNENKAIFLL